MSEHKILQINPLEAKKKLDEEKDLLLLDVREEWEHTLSAIPGSELIPLGQLADRVQELAFEENIVVYCHHGQRSYFGAEILLEAGFKKVYNLMGGIDAWSQIVDPSIPRY
jgi:adenylyltransferase/sulfurtransferase